MDLQFDSQQSWGAIWDRSRPKDEAWKVPNTWPDPKHWTDFGLVSRLRHPSTGRIIITAAGLNRYATGAAGELLTLAEARKALKTRRPTGSAKHPDGDFDAGGRGQCRPAQRRRAARLVTARRSI